MNMEVVVVVRSSCRPLCRPLIVCVVVMMVSVAVVVDISVMLYRSPWYNLTVVSRHTVKPLHEPPTNVQAFFA